jgi:hypothetical protein
MESVFTVLLAVAAGFHAALYGAWKDSPHENFRPMRFWREIIIASVVGLFLCRVDHMSDPLLVYLSAFAMSRIITEFYKLFLRREKQEEYRIPTQVHLAKHVVGSQIGRVVLGLMWLAAIYGLYALLRNFPDTTSPHIVGPAAGLLLGSSLALAGAYKDGYIEGFKFRKFLKSPVAGAIGGLLVSFHTNQLEFLVLGTIALERMFNELLFKLMRPGYVPGKFHLQAPLYPEWLARRRWFLVPYALTWVLAIGLWFWPE